METQLAAPPAVAVVVASDPGPWFDEVLVALAGQDYPNLAVLVIDAGSAVDPSPRVAAVLPNAFVRRLVKNPGYAAAANEAIAAVEGAAYLVLLHDDAAPDPSAVRLMVEEAVRSNAGVVGPKLVRWDDPERLLSVGISVDKTGAPWSFVERNELDQEQHDNVRDVFAIPGGCTLVRSDLFAALGGYDAVMRVHGEDVDFAWRAQLAGARVLVTPEARVRHREALPERPGQHPDRRRLLQSRHRLRSLLKCYGPFGLARVLPQAALAALFEVVFALITGRIQQAADVGGAWWWNVRHFGDTARARRAVQRSRRVGDGDVRRLQVRGSARLRQYLRGQLGTSASGGLAAAGRGIAGSLGRAGRRAPVIAALVALFVLLVGSRDLVGDRLPHVGRFAEFPDGPTTFLRHYLSGWRFSGLGSTTPAPPAFAVLGVGGALLLGAMGVLQKLLVLGALPLGAAGAWWFTRRFGSGRARLVAAVLYLSVPLPYNAIARGRLSALIAYATFPWLLGLVASGTGLDPFPGRRLSLMSAARLGLPLAVATALAPPVAPLLLLAALGLVCGSLLSDGADRAVRGLALAGAGVAVAAVLLVPWTLTALTHWSVFGEIAAPASRALGWGRLLRFHTGPLGSAPLGWALPVAAILPLLAAREWRFEWAVRLWTMALLCWTVAWMSSRHWLPEGLLPIDVLLVPAALGLAVTVALGLAAFETDLRAYRFGWRQAASVTAAAAAGLALLPVLVHASGGRWGAPRSDAATTLTWMRDEVARGEFRVLWVGDAAAVPKEGRSLGGGAIWAVSRNGVGDATELWSAPAGGADDVVPDALEVAAERRTARLGRLLAPAAVRYVVLPTRPAPPARLAIALGEQLDLRRIDVDPSLAVYENTEWVPAVAAGKEAVLRDRHDPGRWTGSAPPGPVTLAEAYSSQWSLRVAGRTQEHARNTTFNEFTSVDQGRASLSFRTPLVRRLLLLLQLVLWFAALRFAFNARREEGVPA